MKPVSEYLRVLTTAKFWKEFIVMTLGMFVAAAAVYYFLVPGKLVIGNVSGLCIVICELLSNTGVNIGVSNMVVIINAILLVMAYVFVGSEFGIKTFYTALILGPLMDVWAWILPYEKLIDPASPVQTVMGDVWFDLLCFVLLLGASQAILFRINASTGGQDILAKILNKYFHFDIGTCVTLSGLAICCTAFFMNPFRLVIIGLIGTLINGLIVDYFTMSLNSRKRVCIISEQYDEIRQHIVTDLHRGCSLYEIRGGFSKDTHIEIQSILTRNEFADLMGWMKSKNINAFITAGNCSEIYGLWFNNGRYKLKD